MTATATKPTPVFSFHLSREPVSLDPALSNGDSSYLMTTVFRGLTRLTAEKELIYDGAERCRNKGTTVICKLRKNLKWSDGSSIRAQDYVYAFRRFFEPRIKEGESTLQLGLKNGKEVLLKSIAPEKLGVKANSDYELEFELDAPDGEFLERLSHPSLVPLKVGSDFSKPEALVTNGPYKVRAWVKGQRIDLEPNSSFQNKMVAPRPLVQIFFVSDDSVALSLYEKGDLKFLRRLPAEHIPKYQNRPDFIQAPLNRFDFIGFSQKDGSRFKDKNLRKAFAEGVDFEEFKKIFFALGRPGCPSLLESLLTTNFDHCQSFQPKPLSSELKAQFEKVPLSFYFSQLGGDDIRRAAEFFQSQWSKHLGVKVALKSLENKLYVKTLREHTPEIFRKGISLDRPTCSAALEIFTTDHPDNFVGVSNARFDDLVKRMKSNKLSRFEQDQWCGKSMDFLFKEEFVGIPLGRMHFTMLIDKNFSGVKINELNQLDLSDLTFRIAGGSSK